MIILIFTDTSSSSLSSSSSYSVGMLLEAGPTQWILQETKEMAEMNFRFVDKMDAASYVTRLANSMQISSPEHIVSPVRAVLNVMELTSFSGYALHRSRKQIHTDTHTHTTSLLDLYLPPYLSLIRISGFTSPLPSHSPSLPPSHSPSPLTLQLNALLPSSYPPFCSLLLVSIISFSTTSL